MQISIADATSDAAELAAFFKSNLNADYISHSELQSYRAVGPHQWADNILSVLENDIAPRLGPARDEFPADRFWQGVVLGHDGARLTALALVTVSRNASVPFGIIEDIVVDEKCRSQGHGETMMRWIVERFRAAGLRRAFLESGLDNKSAHHLFEKLGFQPLSIVMKQDL